jgi:hypothetical protein
MKHLILQVPAYKSQFLIIMDQKVQKIVDEDYRTKMFYFTDMWVEQASLEATSQRHI